jgi:sigma-B regulation protein RsbU (phosphoserine phosphatase)
MARLIVRAIAGSRGKSPRTHTPETVLEMTRIRTTIGRSARNDLCLDDPFASRLHAEIRRLGDTYWLHDLGSANGTYLQGEILLRPMALQHRDCVRVGETEIEFVERIETTLTGTRTNLLIGPRDEQAARIDATAGQGAGRGSGRGSGWIGEAAPAPGLAEGVSATASAHLAPVAARGLDDPLALISRVSQTLLSPLPLEETLGALLDQIFDVIPADRGLVLLLEEWEGEEAPERGHDLITHGDRSVLLVCKAMKRREPHSGGGLLTEEVRISQAITRAVVTEGAILLTSDVREDPRFQERESVALSGLRSVMAVPLAVEGRVTGMIYVDSRVEVKPFTERELLILTLIAGVAAIRVENMALLELQQEQRRLADELALASEIQLGLHPATPPSIEGYDLIGVSFPCYEVGGDYFDFIEKSDGRHVIAVGDVSGKGTGAALLMSSVHAAVRAHTRTRLTAREVVAEINQYIYDNTPPNRYVTLFYSELDPQTHELRYINAGHNAPILLRAEGGVERLQVGGVPVGILPSGEYQEAGTRLSPGDVLVIFSDGATESQNEVGEEFDEERLIEVLLRHRGDRAAVIRDRIDEALARFVGKAKAVDDLTMVIVKRHF